MGIIRPVGDGVGWGIQPHAVIGGMSDQNDTTYLEEYGSWPVPYTDQSHFDPASDCGHVELHGIPKKLSINVRVSSENPSIGSILGVALEGLDLNNTWWVPLRGYCGLEPSILTYNCSSDDISKFGSNGVRIDIDTSMGANNGNGWYGSNTKIYDWWIDTGGIPPLRQRARNDGLTTDTRQEKRQLSASPLLVPDLWWVGAPGHEHPGSST